MKRSNFFPNTHNYRDRIRRRRKKRRSIRVFGSIGGHGAPAHPTVIEAAHLDPLLRLPIADVQSLIADRCHRILVDVGPCRSRQPL